MDNLIAIAPLLIWVGAIAGLLAGLFGVGGGLVIVPALYFLMASMNVDLPTAMAIAVGTSLASIIPTSLSSLRAHHKLGNVDWHIVKRWSPFLVLGVFVGASLISQLRSKAFVAVFGGLLLLIACNKLAGSRWLKPLSTEPKLLWQRLAAFIIGFISVIAGVGGGATGVPTLVYFGVKIHRAVGTCAALGLFIALPGAISVFVLSSTPATAPAGTYHLLYWPALILIVPLTITFAPLGAKLGKKSPRNGLQNYSLWH